MATYKSGILGGFRGTIGPTIGTRWRKKDVIKSRYKKKKKDKKDTEQTLKLSLVAEFLSPFSEVIRMGYHNRKAQNTESSMAKKYHLGHAVKGEMPNFEIDHSKVVLSKGNRETAWAGRVEIKNTRSLRVTWEIPATADLKLIAKDDVHVIIYREVKGKCAHLGYGLTRDMLTHDITVGTINPGDTLHVWIFFTSPDGKNISNSDYIGSVSRQGEPESNAAADPDL